MDFIDLKSQYRRLREPLDRRLLAVFDHARFIQGAEVGELEERLANFVGANHCVCVSSGTDALLIALMALDIGPGDEVITTPFTFVATAGAIALLGATPVFVDIDRRTFNIDPNLVEAAVTRRTRAIVAVSLYGQCAEFERIDAIAARHDLTVIEDAAQSFGATRNGRASCALSPLAATSFYPSKPLGCYGDGGAIFAADATAARLARQLREHGGVRGGGYPRVGLNGRLDTLQAAVLLAKLDIFPAEIEARQAVAGRYGEMLAEAFGDRVAMPGTGGACNSTDDRPGPAGGGHGSTDDRPGPTGGGHGSTDDRPGPAGGGHGSTDDRTGPASGACGPTAGSISRTDGAHGLTNGAPAPMADAPDPTRGSSGPAADAADPLDGAADRRIRLPCVAPGNRSVFAQYTVEVPNRDAVRDSMQSQGIPTAIHYPVPLHLQPAFASAVASAGTSGSTSTDTSERTGTSVSGGTGRSTSVSGRTGRSTSGRTGAAPRRPVAEHIARRVLSLPMHPYLTEDDQARVVAALRRAVFGSRKGSE